MSQQNQPYSNQPWNRPDGQDASPWAEREGQPGLGGHAQLPPAGSWAAGDAGGYRAAPAAGTEAHGTQAPYGQPYITDGRPAEPYGQAAPEYGTPQHGAPPYATSQYGTPQYGTPQYGSPASQSYPPNPYGQPQQYPGQQQYPGRYFGAPPAPPRPVWKKVVGILLAVWSGIALLSTLSQAGSMIARASSRGAAYQVGNLLGLLLLVVLPAVLAWLLLRRRR